MKNNQSRNDEIFCQELCVFFATVRLGVKFFLFIFRLFRDERLAIRVKIFYIVSVFHRSPRPSWAVVGASNSI